MYASLVDLIIRMGLKNISSTIKALLPNDYDVEMEQKKKRGAERVGLTLFRAAVQFLY
jgi:hypothetical protein